MVLARSNLAIQDESGNKIDGASVEVRRESDGGLASLFSDRGGTVGLGNPFTAADGADAGFFVIGGAYKITATKAAFTRTWRYVAVGTAAENDTEFFASAAALTAVDDQIIFKARVFDA